MARIIGRKVRGRDVMEQRGHDHHGGHGDHHALSPSESSWKDPVCGMTVTAESPHRHEHEGRTYFFCSEKCRAKFAADPAKYLAPAPADGARARRRRPPSTPARCIRRSGRTSPGTCPKCGMALEPELPSVEDEENPELADFRRRFWWTLPLTVVVTVLAMFGHQLGWFDMATQSWIELVAVGAGRAVGRLAVLRARRAVDREPQPQHVDADRHRHRRRRSSTASSRRSRPACSRTRSSRWAAWRCTSRPRSSSSR